MKMGRFTHTRKDSHPASVDYVDDQFTLRIQDKGNTVTYTFLDAFSFHSVSSTSNKYEKESQNIASKKPPSKRIGLQDDEGPGIKKILQEISQSPRSSPVIHTLLSEVQYQYFNDTHASEYVLTISTNFLTPNCDDALPNLDFRKLMLFYNSY